MTAGARNIHCGCDYDTPLRRLRRGQRSRRECAQLTTSCRVGSGRGLQLRAAAIIRRLSLSCAVTGVAVLSPAVSKCLLLTGSGSVSSRYMLIVGRSTTVARKPARLFRSGVAHYSFRPECTASGRALRAGAVFLWVTAYLYAVVVPSPTGTDCGAVDHRRAEASASIP